MKLLMYTSAARTARQRRGRGRVEDTPVLCLFVLCVNLYVCWEAGVSNTEEGPKASTVEDPRGLLIRVASV